MPARTDGYPDWRAEPAAAPPSGRSTSGRTLARIRRAVRPLPKAAMFALAEDGHRSLFEQLVGCILGIRTLDEVSLVAARRLFSGVGPK